MNQPASDDPPDSGVSGPTITALPDDASGSAPRAPVSGVAPRHSAAGSDPFASLKQETTVETKVEVHLLDIAKRGALGGATSVYHVPRELLEMARRKKKVAADAPPEPAAMRRASPKAREVAGRAPLRDVCPSEASGRPSTPAESLTLSSILGQSRRAFQRLGSLESRVFESPVLRRSITAVTWLALMYAAYRLMMR